LWHNVDTADCAAAESAIHIMAIANTSTFVSTQWRRRREGGHWAVWQLRPQIFACRKMFVSENFRPKIPKSGAENPHPTLHLRTF